MNDARVFVCSPSKLSLRKANKRFRSHHRMVRGQWVSCARIVFSSKDLSMRLVRIVTAKLKLQLSAATLFTLMTNTAPGYVPWLLAPHTHLIILCARCTVSSLLLLFHGFLSFIRFVVVVPSLLFVLLVMCRSLASTISQQQLNLVRLDDSFGLFYCCLPFAIAHILQSLIIFGFFVMCTTAIHTNQILGYVSERSLLRARFVL